MIFLTFLKYGVYPVHRFNLYVKQQKCHTCQKIFENKCSSFIKKNPTNLKIQGGAMHKGHKSTVMLKLNEFTILTIPSVL